MKRLTLEEIGKLAGVSRATVSRVINNYPHIRPEVRERVERVIKETGYKPNLVARSLASNRSSILGIIIPNAASLVFSDPYFPTLVRGISQSCNESNYTLALFLFHSEQEERTKFQNICQDGLVDGVILTASRCDDPYIPQLLASSIPFVMVGRPCHDVEQISFVDVENVMGAYDAVTHLIRLGYKRIAMIAASQNTTVGIDRRTGYINALSDHGIPVDENLIEMGDFTLESGRRAMQRLFPHRPDAVFAVADAMALGAMQAITAAGLNVPDDIAVVGYDDFSLSLTAEPPLTTVRQPVEHTGRMAVETLIAILDAGVELPRQVILPTELVIRESCGAVRKH